MYFVRSFFSRHKNKLLSRAVCLDIRETGRLDNIYRDLQSIAGKEGASLSRNDALCDAHSVLRSLPRHRSRYTYIYIRTLYIRAILPIQEVCCRVAWNDSFGFSSCGMRVAEYAIVMPTTMWKDAARMHTMICENPKHVQLPRDKDFSLFFFPRNFELPVAN